MRLESAKLADTIASHMPLKLKDKQAVLEMSDVTERLEYLMAMMESKSICYKLKNAFVTALKSRWKKASVITTSLSR